MARRRRKHKKKKGSIFSTIILIIALAVFVVSAIQLIKIGKEYLGAREEYKDVEDIAVTYDKDAEKKGKKDDNFKVDFKKLLEENPDVVGWIRFYPEPKQISYPILQGKDNDEYIHTTISGKKRTAGSIFIDSANSPSFNDKNTIVYGHRMRDGSMFRKLSNYSDKNFWKKNPNFYIYTPDGRKITYAVCTAGVVVDTSDLYKISFADETEFRLYIDAMHSASSYDTGVEITPDSTIVTLSTCTSASDEHRFVLQGMKVKEEQVQ